MKCGPIDNNVNEPEQRKLNEIEATVLFPNHALKDYFIPSLPNPALLSYSEVNRKAHALTADERLIRSSTALLLAVVQGNESEVKRLIESNPDLLLSKKGEAIDYSGRKFKSLTPFQAALCAGDVEMCEMMKEVGFSQLENGQEKLQKQFDEIFPLGIDAHIEEQKQKVFDFDTILQAIKNAPNDEVTEASYKNFDADLPLIYALNEFRRQFKEKSLSEKIFNPFHLQKAFETYGSEFNNLPTWDTCNLFWRQVIGYTQRYLPACYAQAFAQGLYYIVENNEPLNRSFKLRIAKNSSIYPFRGSSGLGFDFAGAADARLLEWLAGRGWWPLAPNVERYFSRIMSDKNIKLSKLTQPAENTYRPCVIQ